MLHLWNLFCCLIWLWEEADVVVGERWFDGVGGEVVDAECVHGFHKLLLPLPTRTLLLITHVLIIGHTLRCHHSVLRDWIELIYSGLGLLFLYHILFTFDSVEFIQRIWLQTLRRTIRHIINNYLWLPHPISIKIQHTLSLYLIYSSSTTISFRRISLILHCIIVWHDADFELIGDILRLIHHHQIIW